MIKFHVYKEREKNIKKKKVNYVELICFADEIFN